MTQKCFNDQCLAELLEDIPFSSQQSIALKGSQLSFWGEWIVEKQPCKLMIHGPDPQTLIGLDGSKIIYLAPLKVTSHHASSWPRLLTQAELNRSAEMIRKSRQFLMALGYRFTINSRLAKWLKEGRSVESVLFRPLLRKNVRQSLSLLLLWIIGHLLKIIIDFQANKTINYQTHKDLCKMQAAAHLTFFNKRWHDVVTRCIVIVNSHYEYQKTT